MGLFFYLEMRFESWQNIAMKVASLNRVTQLAKKLSILFVSLIVTLNLISLMLQEKKEQLLGGSSYEILDYSAMKVLFFTTLILFSAFTFIFALKCIQYLKNDYVSIVDGFIEGPARDGKRLILSASQIDYIGRDLLGEFSIRSEEGSIVLPGKLTCRSELELKRKLRSHGISI